MPKIVIKEYDQTTPGFVSSNNFAVVVPGSASKDPVDVFDENGIFVCNSQADFVEKVGKVRANSVAVSALAAEPRSTGALSAEEFYVTYAGCVYNRVELTKASDKKPGYLVSQENSKWYKYSKNTAAWDSTRQDYTVILPGNEGRNASTGSAQIGNQIAYLLLGLGYTVHYLLINDAERKITDPTIWEPLKDRSLYDFRYLVSGLIDNQTAAGKEMEAVNSIIAAIAQNVSTGYTEGEGRGDCIALCDIPRSVYIGHSSATAIDNIKRNIPSGNAYTANFAPTVYYGGIEDSDYANSNELPASFHYLACASTAFSRYNEWFAVSGYTRGVSGMRVTGTSIKLGDAAVTALQSRRAGSPSVNLVIKLNDSYYLWGNRTGAAITDNLTASNFLNIRQLCCTLKKTIYDTCRHLMFDPNSDMLWLNFCNAIRPVLENMKANQGIADYKFEQQETSLKAKLFAAIRIIPIEAVEDFEIGITLEDGFEAETIKIAERQAD